MRVVPILSYLPVFGRQLLLPVRALRSTRRSPTAVAAVGLTAWEERSYCTIMCSLRVVLSVSSFWEFCPPPLPREGVSCVYRMLCSKLNEGSTYSMFFRLETVGVGPHENPTPNTLELFFRGRDRGLPVGQPTGGRQFSRVRNFHSLDDHEDRRLLLTHYSDSLTVV